MVCELIIVEQQSLAEEKISKNGILKKLHSVVKNTPFHITLGLTENNFDGVLVDFNSFVIESKLVYDCEEPKEVQYVRSAPLEYTVNVDKTNPLRVTVELQIKVLSSQHEDMFFRVNFYAKELKSGKYTRLSTTSHPIRVVSKPNQLTKTKTKQIHKRAVVKEEEPVSGKRTYEETMINLMQTLIEQQRDQQKVLMQLVQRTQNLENIILHSLVPASPTLSAQNPIPSPSQPEMKESFSGLLSAPNNSTPLDERPKKARKLLTSSNRDMIEDLWQSGDESFNHNFDEFLQEEFVTNTNSGGM